MMPSWRKLLLSAVAGVVAGCGGESASREPRGPSELGSLSQGLLASCPFTSPAINMDKELVVRNLSVVNDPCRTQFNGTGCASPNSRGKWSFGYLMSQIAGGKDAAGTSEFVLNWLGTWQTDQNINGHLVAARAGVSSAGAPLGMNKFINTWRTKSNCPATGACTLDFNQAPFRLLAIINRVDLSGNAYGSASPGELRFVFGFVDLNKLGDASSNNGAMKGTVIFEYKLTQHLDTFGWAEEWHRLATYEFSEAYNSRLEQLTNLVATYNPSWIPGGSAISQIRTNEIEFDTAALSNRVWELREQTRDCSQGTCRLRPDTVKLTPDSRYNKGGEDQTDPTYKGSDLDSYLLNNAPLIDAEDLSTLPPHMIGGASRSKSALGQQLVWDLSTESQSSYEQNGGAFRTSTRHVFALQTCGGCHYAETGTSNFHVAPRGINQMAQLSGFLAPSGSESLLPNTGDPTQPYYYTSPTDPVDFETRQYNDLWRRKCEMQRLLHFVETPLFKPSGAH
ncbi:hypothetical protein D187_000595 [Cystobacter fuscus DSM 2262]|uniref:Lipoprotein n=1 Tax=Cystobacter fuscus (strain ATCC 25194 / DSM 2262 / NBRC 100088 / M29) TaxID=1242864 RepID=S9PLR7_CYSF2|nr:hypothetical protein [Cystobacter fuscus]EPX65170.1 hypothetical protein D187_000595 [Cystobacter fuscus DSM 2262]